MLDGHVGSPVFARKADDYKDINATRAELGTLTWDGILLGAVYRALAETNDTYLRHRLTRVIGIANEWIKDIDQRESYYEFPPPVAEDHSDAPHRVSEPMKPEE